MNDKWWYNPENGIIKLLRFLHLIEDERVWISFTGIATWSTTINDIVHLQLVHDISSGSSAAMSAIANGVALWFHHAKRKQELDAGKM